MKYIKLYEQFLFEKKNFFNNKTLQTVQLLPHNFERSGNDVVSKEIEKFDKNKPSILLLPGGDGKPAVDFRYLAKFLPDYNLFSLNYDQSKFGDIESWSTQMAKDAVKKIPGEFSVLAFSLGSSIGYFAIKNVFLSDSKFTKKFVCVDAGLPPVSSGDQKKDNEASLIKKMNGNPPLKYLCIRKSLVGKDQTAGPEDVLEFRYKFKKEFEPGKKYTAKDFNFDKEKEYEEFRKKGKLVYEFFDDPTGKDRSHVYPDNPSKAFSKGVEIPIEEARNLEKKMSPNDVWIIKDSDWKEEKTGKKSFWFENNFQFTIDWFKEHIKNTGKGIPADEKLPSSVKVLFLKAGGTTDKIEKYELERPPSKDTKVEIIPNCVHGNMLELSTTSSKIAKFTNEFLK